MPSWLYEAGPNGHWVFLLVTIILGGTTAFVSGRAIAETWRPIWQIAVYSILLGMAVRFIHYALFEEVFLSLRNFIVDVLVLAPLMAFGYRLTRVRQMVQQYGWMDDGAP